MYNYQTMSRLSVAESLKRAEPNASPGMPRRTGHWKAATYSSLAPLATSTFR
jgi:hypothetical protein